MKTIRFSQLVQKCGEPEVYTQWIPAEKDLPLQAAIGAHKVMTIHVQTVGARKDHGEIGYLEGGQRVLLVFPRSLARFQERKVVGIDYDLLRKEPEGRVAKAVKVKAVKAEPKETAVKVRPVKVKAVKKERVEPVKAEPKETAIKVKAVKKERVEPVQAEPKETAVEVRPVKAKTVKAKTVKVKAVKVKTVKAKTVKPKPLHEKPVAVKPKVKAEKPEASPAALRRAIQKAMKLLQAGKAVQAYQHLEKSMQ